MANMQPTDAVSKAISMDVMAPLTEAVKSRPDEPAFIIIQDWTKKGDPIISTTTFRQMALACNAMAQGLEMAGIRKGMKIGFMVPPGIDFFTAFVALLQIGAIPVLVDPGMGLTRLKKCFEETAPEAFIGNALAHMARLVFGWAGKSIKINISVGDKKYCPWKGYSLKKMKDMGSTRGPYVRHVPAEEDIVLIAYTSGNTGMPKGVVVTHGILGAQRKLALEEIAFQADTVFLATYPPFALMALLLGATSVIPETGPVKPSEKSMGRLVKIMEVFQCTDLSASPAVIEHLGKYCEQKGIRLTHQRRISCTGAPSNIPSLKRFAKLLSPGVEILIPYGSTEAAGVAVVGSDYLVKEADSLTQKGAGHCVGFPVGEVEIAIIKIIDEAIPEWSDHLKIPEGEIGEICVKGPHITTQYYNRPEETRLAKIKEPWSKDVWHRMGDTGYLDKQGRLWLCGRKSHRVQTRFGTLFPLSCEAIFNCHPKVFRSALVGVQHNGEILPVICIEVARAVLLSKKSRQKLTRELLDLGKANALTENIQTIFYHPKFPVDIRHSSKILREKIACWAQKKYAAMHLTPNGRPEQ